MTNSIEIGEKIRKLLEFNNKKQKELAEHLGVSDNTISYFCSGQRIPNTVQISMISDFFGCSADYLLSIKTPQENTYIKQERLYRKRELEHILAQLNAIENTLYELIDDVQDTLLLECGEVSIND